MSEHDCLFCKIIKGEIPANKVFEDDELLAFHDIAPVAPVHILIIPKKHIASMNEVTPEDESVISHMLLTAQRIALDMGIAAKGYRLVNNCGPEGGQVIYHLHFHLLGGQKLSALN